MRKADREIKDRAGLIAILDASDVCRLGLADGGQPYIVPMNFGYEMAEDGRLTLYFHCATEGRKLDILAKNQAVCFEMDCAHELRAGDLPCKYSMNYESVIGFGEIEILSDRADKVYGLTQLMRHYGAPEPGKPAESSFVFSATALEKTTVLRLHASEFTGKRLKNNSRFRYELYRCSCFTENYASKSSLFALR